MIKHVIHDMKTGLDGKKFVNEAAARKELAQAIPAGRFIIRIKDGNKVIGEIK